MIFRILIGLLVILNACPSSELRPISGLQIENGPNRGLNYTDPIGTQYSYRYIPITITNDSIISIEIQIALSNEYDYPAAYGDQKFKVFLLPKELTGDKVSYDTMSYELGDNKLRNFFDRGLTPPYILKETLEPGEKSAVTIGTLYPRPTNCGHVPNVFFVQSDRGNFQECDNLMLASPAGGNQDKSINSHLALGLKLDFCTGCTLIPCGQIFYPDR